MEDEPINLIGCDTIVNSPSFVLFFHFRSSGSIMPKSCVAPTTSSWLENPSIFSSGGKSWFLAKLNFITFVFFSFIFSSFLEVNCLRQSRSSCNTLSSGFNICLVLSLKFRGIALFTGSVTRQSESLTADSILRSSMYLRCCSFVSHEHGSFSEIGDEDEQ